MEVGGSNPLTSTLTDCGFFRTDPDGVICPSLKRALALEEVVVAAEMPSGVVTFLFTDIEGSTRLLQDLGAGDYAELQEVHRSLLRTAFAAHNGVEVNTEGDSFFVAFASAVDGVQAALAGQRAFTNHDWGNSPEIRVRIGVHTGEAIPRAGDYTAIAVNCAARISAAAHGGQALVSAATQQLLPGPVPKAELRPLGLHRLKDLAAPVGLFQLMHADLRAEFPPLSSLETVAHNLPIQLSSFVGREMELAEVAKSLSDARLLTLVGPGGIGKTRLAFHAAAEMFEEFPGGIWVAELATVSDPTGVAQVLLRALALSEEPGADPADTVIDHLRERQALVILDNCEQVVDACATLAEALLTRSPGVRVLATSREALRVPGELAYQVPGLGLPSTGLPDYLDALAEADAARLFVARASEVHAGFRLSADNGPDIAAICSRLDGLPLAIELAASRVRSLSPAQINQRLGQTLDLLSKGARTADARQATLRGTIDWSHRLLSEPEQVQFRRLSVFTGGWRLDAAEEVCAGNGLDQAMVLDTLEALIDKSLVAAGEDNDGTARYRLLETIGAYAAERLEEAGEADTVADRHATWCLTLAAESWAVGDGNAEQARCFDRLEEEHANLLAGLDQLSRRRADQELELAYCLSRFWDHRGHWRVALARLDAALRAGTGGRSRRATALTYLGEFASKQGHYSEARACQEEALVIAREVGDRGFEGYVLVALGKVASKQGHYSEARACHEEALAIARDLGDRRAEAFSIGALGSLAMRQGDLPGARAWYEEALAIARDLGDRLSAAIDVGNLGLIAARLGDYPEARARCEEALATARELGERRVEGYWVGALGTLASKQGDYPEARARLEEALEIACDLGERGNEGEWAGELGVVATRQNDYPEAQAHLEEALAIARELGNRDDEVEWLSGLGVVATRQNHYPEARARLEEALAIARKLDLAGRTVAAVESIAPLLAAIGRHADATELFAWAEQERRRADLFRHKPAEDSADWVATDARAALGDEAFERARESGGALSTAEMFDLAEKCLSSISGSEGQPAQG